MEFWLVLFLAIQALGAAIVISTWFDKGPLSLVVLRDDPHRIFRFVKREDRSAYVRIMRRTLAVQMRDLNRQLVIVGRQIGKALLPVIRNIEDAFSKAFGSRP